MLALIHLNIILSFLIALLGRNKKMGFWGYFFSSLVLTAPIGLLLVLVSAEQEKNT